MAESPKERQERIQHLIQIVADEAGVTRRFFVSDCRRRRPTRLRAVVTCLATRLVGASQPQIARALDRKDHTFVTHSLQMMDDYLQEDPELQELLDRVQARFNEEDITRRTALAMVDVAADAMMAAHEKLVARFRARMERMAAEDPRGAIEALSDLSRGDKPRPSPEGQHELALH